MAKAHEVENVVIQGTLLTMTVDGAAHDVELADHSATLANATQAQRDNITVSPSGYGLHWPDLDEDLSIDGLIGVKHTCPITKSAAQ